MTRESVSVIVVSRGRPESLALCLTALTQQTHENFEIVIVADNAGQKAVADHDAFAHVKLIAFDAENISAARNAGIAASGGELTAFIDDDAFADPIWLEQLTAPFSDAAVMSAGGFVRGRNGISFQWRGRKIDRAAQHTPINIAGSEPVVLEPIAGHAVRTEGTNCAFRRSALAELDGFDAAFRYYHDDADLNFRMADRGWSTALVPNAQVLHAVAESKQRFANRMPRSLWDIGESTAAFLSRHCPSAERAKARDDIRFDERRRLLRHMVAGHCDPSDVTRMLRQFDQGYQSAARRGRDSAGASELATGAAFRRYPGPGSERSTTVLAGWSWQRDRLREQAADLVRRGSGVSLFLFSPTTLFHHVTYRHPGYWEQTGGVYGRSERTQKLFAPQRFAERLEKEIRRVAKQRRINQS